jgi:hypothetical protein
MLFCLTQKDRTPTPIGERQSNSCSKLPVESSSLCDPAIAPAMCGVAVSAGSIQNVELMRLFTMEEIADIRQKARQNRGAYKPPGQQ